MDSLVSIIMPSFNSEDTIGESIKSVISQSYDEWELLITDDCSTDNTIKIVESFSLQDSRIKFFQNVINSGAAISRNKSLAHARGEFIAFLDSDDLWLSDKLQTQIDFMNKKSGVNFSFTAYDLINAEGNSIGKIIDQQGDNLSFSYQDMLQKKATLGCSTVIFRRNAFDDYTMPLIRTGQDYALWLKLLKTGNNAYLLNDVLTRYRILPNSISRNKFKKCKRQWEIYRTIEKLTLPNAVVSFLFYAWRAIFRR